MLLQIEISNFAQKLVFKLGQGYGSTKINDDPEVKKNMSQLFKPGQVTQFQLEFDLSTEIVLKPVDGTDPDGALAAQEISVFSFTPVVVTVDALEHPEAVIVVDQMPGNAKDDDDMKILMRSSALWNLSKKTTSWSGLESEVIPHNGYNRNAWYE